ncbi:Aldehyde/histidinol dehydrogenase [Aspergillus caelatus]|uniref:Aldehyde/histidinol dehydrogenase n=1 Tax=Aspergillus caelatus TaxID=61420 RepID=A0A5N6ZT42_9EURO|nr:Aldehyde/histidinol dehydrogenase [Aspergillus caelatus]KAE8360771.1 Aldehyde/histidinol dehydrogenase [Aspergillus caelatus]
MESTSLDLVLTTALEGRMKDLRTRQRILRTLHAQLIENTDDLLRATVEDDRVSREEAQVILSASLSELRAHYDKLDLKEELEAEYSIARKESCLNKRVPFGIVYVVPDVYTAVFSIITALSAAIAAGNCVVIELQDSLRRSPKVLRHCLADLQYNDAVSTVAKRPGPEFMRHCLLVHQMLENNSKQSECLHLLASTPQRTVAIVDRTADANAAAKEIVASRILFQAQGRYSVDQVFVNEYIIEAFHIALTKEIATSLTIKDSKLKANDPRGTNRGPKVASEKPGLPVLEICDRSDPLLHRRQKTLGVIIHKITSLDDAIDTISESGQRLGALYVFAGSDEAKYLSQFISSRATFVNHVPPELQIGPAYPEGFETSIALRYTREMFENPQPERVDDGKVQHSTTLWNHIKDGRSPAILSKACRPLKPTGQGKAGAMDFFLQGMILNLIVCVLPLTALSVVATGKSVSLLYQRFLSR